jgi:hypothetical protein
LKKVNLNLPEQFFFDQKLFELFSGRCNYEDSAITDKSMSAQYFSKPKVKVPPGRKISMDGYSFWRQNECKTERAAGRWKTRRPGATNFLVQLLLA